jgi:hypothetical protein
LKQIQNYILSILPFSALDDAYRALTTIPKRDLQLQLSISRFSPPCLESEPKLDENNVTNKSDAGSPPFSILGAWRNNGEETGHLISPKTPPRFSSRGKVEKKVDYCCCCWLRRCSYLASRKRSEHESGHVARKLGNLATRKGVTPSCRERLKYISSYTKQ